MGSYDRAEICELVELYLSNRLSTVIGRSSVGLYRDDGLAAINNANVPKLDRIKKDIICIMAYYFIQHRNKSYQNRYFRCYLQPCNKEILSFSKG